MSAGTGNFTIDGDNLEEMYEDYDVSVPYTANVGLGIYIFKNLKIGGEGSIIYQKVEPEDKDEGVVNYYVYNWIISLTCHPFMDGFYFKGGVGTGTLERVIDYPPRRDDKIYRNNIS